jgi:predicted TIM-barrel fold metal-dependent hydrolase
MKLVDAHAHIFLADMPHIPNPRHVITYDYTLEQFLADLDRHGVSHGVIAAASPYGDYNDYVLDSIRGNPRLRGTVIVEPSVERVTLQRMKDDGIVGVRLPYISLTTLPDLTTFENQRTLRRFRDLDWHVHLHLDGPRLPQALPVLEKSGVKLVVDHFGRPDPKLGIQCPGFQMMLRLMENGRTWVKVSGAYRLGRERAREYGKELLRAMGPDRLFWGSDAPFVGHENQFSYQSTIDDVLEWCPEKFRQQIFFDNAFKFHFS